jgi:DNA-binding transcriptional ArsR family regulator
MLPWSIVRSASNSTTTVELRATLNYAGQVSEDVIHPPVEEINLPRVLAALADPARLATVRTLALVGESPCGQIQHDAGLAVSKSTMSHHLRILREAGIVYSRVQGARRMLTLRRDDLDARFPGLLDAVLQPELAPSR